MAGECQRLFHSRNIAVLEQNLHGNLWHCNEISPCQSSLKVGIHPLCYARVRCIFSGFGLGVLFMSVQNLYHKGLMPGIRVFFATNTGGFSRN